ncbi:outer membrane protein assembly factor BamD [Gilvimarinus agarilyticus]|uniref:outer membrane protein assembly factor BamD n=1 Tax=unclassified Gilvimarinus TaxID=2642066 RepID=UPI001C086F83|nr:MULTISPECIES: outer membrane protein assembly factor BamD [unclassified Gilvimarinus]MBU2885202.1 outer membrane protein assembly factor BamD [Gilvimarinus agarilyticus]MDO6570099.1 outer membrane protein assembly factor BamD [Gilvimarinus sp. 2_MG-2023]MDO6748271.1 outer membrane protein assembly factor BamD [Gilvimarinus sp. 1_MG-2023]
MRALVFFLSGALMLLSACSSTGERQDLTSEADVYDRAIQHLQNSRWESAISSLQLIEEHFPFGKYAEQAQLEIIFAYYKSGDPDAAIAAADRFIRLHPQHRNVDYAYYMKGLSTYSKDENFLSTVMPLDQTQRDPGAARESLGHFTQLLNRYPDSTYAEDAKKRMLYLRNRLARYEIHVANYYFKRGAYLASINRGQYVLENFQETPAVPDALAVIVQGYHLLGMDELSDRTLAVLRLNYPDHPAFNNEGDFDFQHGDIEDRSWISKATFGLFDKRDPRGFDSRRYYAPQYQDTPRVSQ